MLDNEKSIYLKYVEDIRGFLNEITQVKEDIASEWGGLKTKKTATGKKLPISAMKKLASERRKPESKRKKDIEALTLAADVLGYETNTDLRYPDSSLKDPDIRSVFENIEDLMDQQIDIQMSFKKLKNEVKEAGFDPALIIECIRVIETGENNFENKSIKRSEYLKALQDD